MTVNQHIPMIPLRGLVVFPKLSLHIDVGRTRSMAAVEEAMATDHLVFLVTQQHAATEEPTREDFYSVGVVARIKQLVKLPNDAMRLIVEGQYRAKITEMIEEKDATFVNVDVFEDDEEVDVLTESFMRLVTDQFSRYVKMNGRISPDTIDHAKEIEEPGRLADYIATQLPLKMKGKQEILRITDVRERLETLMNRLQNEQEILVVEKRINSTVKRAMEKTQKEFYLREQMKAIQKELGDKDGKQKDSEALREKIAAAGMPEETMKVALKELARYEAIPVQAAESSVIRNYLDWLVAIPWSEETKDRHNLKKAEQILNKDHEGLDKVKERILEFLAVQQLKGSLKGPILCLVGPPGVGKTSLAQSVATSLNRHFVRMSLGGVRDESEIRGHRRTYVGAMPGRIIQGMKKAGTTNPVFLLDEIDKMANDFRGDPAAAMLEVLDPEQNSTFSDHFIEEPYNLSNVLFIATANDLGSIPGPLRDRMEVIQIAGYTEHEKLAIAKNHLLPKQIEAHGLTKSQVQVKEDALRDCIRYYTREAGVRNLNRVVATLCRKAAGTIVRGDKKKVIFTAKNLEDILGKHRFHYGQANEENLVGVATGLAYTTAGGDTLQIEVSISPGTGKIQLTGKLGDVMKESAQTALSYVRSQQQKYDIEDDFFAKHDVHIHVPEGAVPKDGPSAGVTMVTALTSAITNTPILKEVGMTGEVTLRGRVLPIGGLKEKSLSAHRAGLKTIIIPKENERDLEDIPQSIREELTFHAVSNVEQVLQIALDGGNK
ncbi:endopeptidase La [Kurthia massiliensis]|uniref:endopeptidase La n=1 Tax=Kurthia massiliensis TaxID=1033739 RepID=UPI000288DDAA|nr:endopeptidase La [Kurthia massiliensis]